MATEDQRLTPLRIQIDALDAEILSLLLKRARAAQEVGHIKGESASPIFRPERELQVIAGLLEIPARGPFPVPWICCSSPRCK